MKTAVVCGAGGFIASHLVKRLKREGYWVRGVDIKKPEFSATAADEFRVLDLREPENCHEALTLIVVRRMKSINSLPIWAAWDLSIARNAKLCAITRSSMFICHMLPHKPECGVTFFPLPCAFTAT